MNKINKFSVLGLLFVLIGGIYYLTYFPRYGNQTKAVGQGRPERDSSSGPKIVQRSPSRSGGAEHDAMIEPLKALEQFDRSMNDLRNSRGDDWVTGLKKLSDVVNELSKQPDFKSFTAAALMTKAMSDLAITRLMTGEVSGATTISGLDKIDYNVPSDEKLIEFICQYYANGEEVRIKHSSDSVMEFASRFESDDNEFPKEDWVDGWTMKGLITERKATMSLFGIAGAKLRLQLARVTALYLSRGGDFKLRGKELETDLTIRVGKEVAQISAPQFFKALGNMNPTSSDISKDIEMVLYEQQNK